MKDSFAPVQSLALTEPQTRASVLYNLGKETQPSTVCRILYSTFKLNVWSNNSIVYSFVEFYCIAVFMICDHRPSARCARDTGGWGQGQWALWWANHRFFSIQREFFLFFPCCHMTMLFPPSPPFYFLHTRAAFCLANLTFAQLTLIVVWMEESHLHPHSMSRFDNY